MRGRVVSIYAESTKSGLCFSLLPVSLQTETRQGPWVGQTYSLSLFPQLLNLPDLRMSTRMKQRMLIIVMLYQGKKLFLTAVALFWPLLATCSLCSLCSEHWLICRFGSAVALGAIRESAGLQGCIWHIVSHQAMAPWTCWPTRHMALILQGPMQGPPAAGGVTDGTYRGKVYKLFQGTPPHCHSILVINWENLFIQCPIPQRHLAVWV